MDTSLESGSFKMMADCSLDVLCRVTIEDMLCTYCSPSSAQVLGWKPEEMLQHLLKDLIHPDDMALGFTVHARIASENCDVPMSAIRVRKRDGSYAWIEVNSCLMRDPDTQAPWQLLLIMRDITERLLLKERVETLLLTDPLTGLGNRRAFDQALEREWRRAHREHAPLSLLLLDLDDFKGVNDEYGHLVGDACLSTIAATIHATLQRPGDLAVRYGGEEIAIILPATDLRGASLLAEHVRSSIQALQLPHARNAAHSFVVTASVGAATALVSPGGKIAVSAYLVQAADRALYEAKKQGRNRVAAAPPLSTGRWMDRRPAQDITDPKLSQGE